MTAAAETLKMKTELELIKELKKLGFSNKEIKKRLGE
jgi:DNA-binding transcriptional MerR regulator